MVRAMEIPLKVIAADGPGGEATISERYVGPCRRTDGETGDVDFNANAGPEARMMAIAALVDSTLMTRMKRRNVIFTIAFSPELASPGPSVEAGDRSLEATRIAHIERNIQGSPVFPGCGR